MTQRLAPDALLLQTNLTGTVSAIQDDPDAPDASWLTASSVTTASILRVSFPTPTGSLPHGAGLQEFRVWVRKTSASGTPTTTIELWENGSLVSTLLAATNVTSTTGQLLSATWDSTSLTTGSGANVECRLTGTVGGSGGNRATIEVGAVEWNATTGIYSVSISDSLTTTESIARDYNPDRDGADTGVTADAVATLLARIRTAADSLALADVATNPALSIELWENGVFVASLGQYSVSDGVLSLTWNASLLAQINGTGVELRLVPLYASVDIGAVEWNVSRAYVGDAARQQHNISRTTSDTRSLADTIGTPVQFATATDAITTTDSNTQRRNVLVRPDSDTTTTADTATRDHDPKRNPADSTAMADAVARADSFGRTSADTKTTADTASRAVAQARSASDTTAETDTSAVTRAPKRTSADTVATGETNIRDYDPARSPADTATSSDTATRAETQARPVSDTRTTVDTSTRSTVQARSASDSDTTADTNVRSTGLARTTSDSDTTTDVATTPTQQRTSSDALTTADSNTRSATLGRSSSETTSQADVATRSAALSRTAGDALATVESVATATVRSYTRTVADAIADAESLLRSQGLARAPPDTRTTSEIASRGNTQARSTSEALAATETSSATRASGRSGNDPATTTETAVRTAPLARATADTRITSDAAAQALARTASATDTRASTDTAARSTSYGRSAADALATSDAGTPLVARSRAGADTLSTSDSAARSSTEVRTGTDAASSTDTATRSPALNRALTETTVSAETLSRSDTLNRTTADTASRADTDTRGVALARTAGDTETATDSGTATATRSRPISDTTTTTDSAGRGEALTRTAAGAATTTDTATRALTEARSLAETRTSAEATTRTMTLARTAADSSTATETATRTETLGRTAADIQITTDLASGGIIRVLAETLSTTDTAVRGSTAGRQAAETTSTTETATRGAALTRTGADSSTITDTASRAETGTRSATDTQTPTESTTRSVGAGRTAADTERAGDSVARAEALTRAGADTLAFSESVVRSLALSRTASDALTTVDAASAASRGATRSTADTVTCLDSLTKTVSQARAPPDTRTTADTAAQTLSRSRSAADTLVISENLGLGPQFATTTDSLTFADATTRADVNGRTGAETVGRSDTGGRAQFLARSAAETRSLAEVATQRATAVRPITDTRITTDQAARTTTRPRPIADSRSTVDTYVRRISESRSFADAVLSVDVVATRVNRSRRVSEFVDIFDVLKPQPPGGSLTPSIRLWDGYELAHYQYTGHWTIHVPPFTLPGGFVGTVYEMDLPVVDPNDGMTVVDFYLRFDAVDASWVTQGFDFDSANPPWWVTGHTTRYRTYPWDYPGTLHAALYDSNWDEFETDVVLQVDGASDPNWYKASRATITAVTPRWGSPGAQIAVTGRHLDQVTVVQLVTNTQTIGLTFSKTFSTITFTVPAASQNLYGHLRFYDSENSVWVDGPEFAVVLPITGTFAVGNHRNIAGVFPIAQNRFLVAAWEAADQNSIPGTGSWPTGGIVPNDLVPTTQTGYYHWDGGPYPDTPGHVRGAVQRITEGVAPPNPTLDATLQPVINVLAGETFDVSGWVRYKKRTEDYFLGAAVAYANPYAPSPFPTTLGLPADIQAGDLIVAITTSDGLSSPWNHIGAVGAWPAPDTNVYWKYHDGTTASYDFGTSYTRVTLLAYRFADQTNPIVSFEASGGAEGSTPGASIAETGLQAISIMVSAGGLGESSGAQAPGWDGTLTPGDYTLREDAFNVGHSIADTAWGVAGDGGLVLGTFPANQWTLDGSAVLLEETGNSQAATLIVRLNGAAPVRPTTWDAHFKVQFYDVNAALLSEVSASAFTVNATGWTPVLLSVDPVPAGAVRVGWTVSTDGPLYRDSLEVSDFDFSATTLYWWEVDTDAGVLIGTEHRIGGWGYTWDGNRFGTPDLRCSPDARTLAVVRNTPGGDVSYWEGQGPTAPQTPFALIAHLDSTRTAATMSRVDLTSTPLAPASPNDAYSSMFVQSYSAFTDNTTLVVGTAVQRSQTWPPPTTQINASLLGVVNTGAGTATLLSDLGWESDSSFNSFVTGVTRVSTATAILEGSLNPQIGGYGTRTYNVVKASNGTISHTGVRTNRDSQCLAMYGFTGETVMEIRGNSFTSVATMVPGQVVGDTIVYGVGPYAPLPTWAHTSLGNAWFAPIDGTTFRMTWLEPWWTPVAYGNRMNTVDYTTDGTSTTAHVHITVAWPYTNPQYVAGAFAGDGFGRMLYVGVVLYGSYYPQYLDNRLYYWTGPPYEVAASLAAQPGVSIDGGALTPLAKPPVLLVGTSLVGVRR